MNQKQRIFEITAVLLMIDQIIKLIIRSKMSLFQEIVVIPNFFSILYVQNTGAAFSFLENSTFLLIIISVVFILLLNNYIKKESSHFNLYEVISYGMIMGGIFGNLIDRLLHHSVIDYLSFTFGSYQFAIFNFADICIVLGVILLIIVSIFEKKIIHRE